MASPFRHASNLRTPLDRQDMHLLLAIGDEYRLGPAVAPKAPQSLTPEQLVSRGIVGLYVTEIALENDAVKRLTGWSKSVLGQELSGG